MLRSVLVLLTQTLSAYHTVTLTLSTGSFCIMSSTLFPDFNEHAPVAMLPSTMTAALFYAPEDVRLEKTPTPVPEVGGLVIRVDAALTCGTDIKAFHRGHPVLLKNFPCPFGHECCGTVVAMGDDVTGFAIGDRVVAANSAPCYECFYCQRGQTNLCEHLDLLNGAYAQYMAIPAQITRHNTYKVPAHVCPEVAAFAEPLSVCIRAVALSDVIPGSRVAVLGTGPIGQLLIKTSTIMGAHVTAFGRSESKQAMAKEFGGAHVLAALNFGQAPEEIKARYTDAGRGFDVVIEAVGRPESWEWAVGLVRKGGTVNLFGGCKSGTTVTLPTRPLHYDEIKIISLFHHTPAYFKQAVEWLCEGVFDPTPLIHSSVPLSDWRKAFELVESGQAVKVAVKPGL